MNGALASAVLYYLHTAGPAGIYACGGGFGPRHDGVRRARTGNRPPAPSSAQESPGFSRGEWSMLPLLPRFGGGGCRVASGGRPAEAAGARTLRRRPDGARWNTMEHPGTGRTLPLAAPSVLPGIRVAHR